MGKDFLVFLGVALVGTAIGLAVAYGGGGVWWGLAAQFGTWGLYAAYLIVCILREQREG